MVVPLEDYQHVCDRESLPQRGKKTIYIEGIKLLLIACETGIYALEDRDPQTGGSLAHAKVLDCVLTSPNTGARYSLQTGQYLGGGQSPLQSHWLPLWRVRVKGDKVYVSRSV
ncbi:MAG: hypothetical protein GX613_02605 [Chloroflexi bacterium]|nr:hypothetical protein [Chloroflexota bacterium]